MKRNGTTGIGGWKISGWIVMMILISLPLVAMGNPNDATQRMKERLAQVDALKLNGLVGEALTGFLVARGDLNAEQAELMAAENADRQIVYAAVAQRTRQSVAQVGQQRALRIAELAAPGVWLQRPDGTWYQR